MDGLLDTEERHEHVSREQLPWRRDRLTECGRPADDVASVINRATLLSSHQYSNADFTTTYLAPVRGTVTPPIRRGGDAAPR